MLAGVGLVYLVSILATRRMAGLDIGELHPITSLATATISFALLSLLLLFSRTYYSRTFMLVAFLVVVTWLILGRWLKKRLFRPRLAVEPDAVRPEVFYSSDADWHTLLGPSLPVMRFDGLVADQDSADPDWQRFHTQCELGGLPVYHGPLVSEQITGRVSLERLSSGHMSDMRPRPVYALFKRGFDVATVVVTAPLTGPLILLIALAIRADSPGPVFFTQQRIGQGGRLFRMVKFRSMRADVASAKAQFAGQGDDRITRVGQVIRRLRIDELPQFWNVLKGEMSIIGPRPEQVDFAKRFESSIPFYGYRHLVKPGISGWAQVMQGYADSEAGTRDKLEYDLYYAKHCSFWLDMLIGIRTFRILLTGEGAR
ncbi:UNVERIFIED_CONTAM: exopolysaccharide biosynthesis polyprenyl glycosylphosphotransferase [Spiribacter pallidus]|jgi:lipopolysaccharide/colanic/teichoic acid biosynthesis glycosyltransferase